MASSKYKFKIGDLVVLKSGGPVMTISEYYIESYVCQWFSGKKLESGQFAEDALNPAPEESDAKH